jgi:hypothetical protein
MGTEQGRVVPPGSWLEEWVCLWSLLGWRPGSWASFHPFLLFPEGAEEETAVVHLQQTLLCSWGGPLPGDRLCPGVLPADLPVGRGSGEWPKPSRAPLAFRGGKARQP